MVMFCYPRPRLAAIYFPLSAFDNFDIYRTLYFKETSI